MSFYCFNTKDNEKPKIKVHLDDGLADINDLEEWPVVLEIDSLRIYLRETEATDLYIALGRAVKELLSIKEEVKQGKRFKV